VLDRGTWYYLEPGSGAMATGWKMVDGKWYHLQPSGAMTSNTWVGDYYVGGDGSMLTGACVDGYYVGEDGKWIPNYVAPEEPGKPDPDPDDPKDPVAPNPDPDDPKDPVTPDPDDPKDPTEPDPDPEEPEDPILPDPALADFDCEVVKDAEGNPGVSITGYHGSESTIVVPSATSKGVPVTSARLTGSRNITTVDASGCASLRSLDCSSLMLTDLELEGCDSLETLDCGMSVLFIDPYQLPSLTELRCTSDQSEFDSAKVSTWGALNASTGTWERTKRFATPAAVGEPTHDGTDFDFREVNLPDAKAIAITGYHGNNPDVTIPHRINGYEVTHVILTDNPAIESIDASGCPSLRVLICGWTMSLGGGSDTVYALRSVNVAGCDKLLELECRNGSLDTIDLAGCGSLEYLNIMSIWSSQDDSQKKLDTLDLSDCASLSFLECSGHPLANLTLPATKALRYIGVSGSHLTSLELEGYANLENLSCASKTLASLRIASCPSLKGVGAAAANGPVTPYVRNELATLEITDCPAMTSLTCYDSNVSSLDLQGMPRLEYVELSGNQLTSLDASGLAALKNLSCRNNQLASLSIDGCAQLQRVDCSENQLAALCTGKVPRLTMLLASGNPLTDLDVSQATALESLYIDRSSLTAFDPFACPSLTELQCFGCADLDMTLIEQWGDLDTTDHKNIWVKKNL